MQPSAIMEEMMVKHQVTWDDVLSRIELASGVLHHSGLPLHITQQHKLDDFIVYEFCIEGGTDLIFSVERQIHDVIAEQPYSPVDDFIYFCCSSR